MNVLVTGGAGYIGSHTCAALAAAGFTPVVYDNFSSGHLWAVNWGPHIHADLRDQASIVDALREYQIGAVVHFAALAHVGESIADPVSYYDTNVVGTLRLLSAMGEVGVKTLVFSSSCSVYGEVSGGGRVNEMTPLLPISPYGETKLACEQAIAWHAQPLGLRWLALRYFNAVGADPNGRLGEDHDPVRRVLSRIIHAGLGTGPELAIYGNDYPTRDGTAVRDYVHVSDIASAHVLALHRLLEPTDAPNVINLGAGRGLSVLDLVREAEVAIERPVPLVYHPRRAGDPSEIWADIGLAEAELNWRPKASELASIVRTALDWHRGHPTTRRIGT